MTLPLRVLTLLHLQDGGAVKFIITISFKSHAPFGFQCYLVTLPFAGGRHAVPDAGRVQRGEGPADEHARHTGGQVQGECCDLHFRYSVILVVVEKYYSLLNDARRAIDGKKSRCFYLIDGKY